MGFDTWYLTKIKRNEGVFKGLLTKITIRMCSKWVLYPVNELLCGRKVES